jgi:SSS family solute:Na+ symporter
MMKAFYLLCACVLMQVVFSLIWPAQHTEESEKLYWSSPLEPLREKGWPGIGNYKLLSGLLIACMVILYYLFR